MHPLFVAGCLASLSIPKDSLIRVRSKSFVYATAPDGSAAQSWDNLAAGARLDLGRSPEVELEAGGPQSPTRVKLAPSGQPPEIAPDGSSATLHLRSADDSLAVTITLQADSKWPLMHKHVVVMNTGKAATRLLNVVLGRYPAGRAQIEGGDRGFPLYLNRQFFLSLTHPAGFAHVEGKDVVLRQYPGVRLAPGQSFRSMEAVYGVAQTGGARKLFVDYVRSRMARVIYGHEKPYAILEAFGGQPEGDFKENYSIGVSESYLVRHLQQVAASERENGVQFDFYGLEFWHDRAGSLKEFSRANFPNGFGRVRDEILRQGMKPGLWIDSGGLPEWSVDLNPATAPSRTGANGQGSFCRASEPIASVYREGFLYQMSENKAGLLKFDNLNAVCDNPAHDHLPGPLYSTEAIYNSVIGFFQTLRKANPDGFIMLYWHYRSPWWLEYGDTYFESGDQIEAASPAQYPTPYARDAVTQRLDQAQMKITDTPWLGKDSLGVWLSDWTWNSGIGKARWQEGVIMDIARGGQLFQLWTDADWLTPPERDQVATFIKLLKANADCFDHSRFFLGDPNLAEPYGYSCSNGRKAFLAIHNACLRDSTVRLDLGPSCGLPARRKWDVYRWYPRPSLLGGQGARGTTAAISMRPYEVDLLEVVPAGEGPSLGRHFSEEPMGAGFAEKSRALEVGVRLAIRGGTATWTALRPSSAVSAKNAKLTVQRDGSILAGGANDSNDTYTIKALSGSHLTGIMLEALTDPSLPANGPGRAVNGNFALNGVRIAAAPRNHPEQAQEIKLRSATADYSQTSFGGWPASATIDADLRTGWSIHPLVGIPHALVWELEKPVDLPPGTTMTITLYQGENHHNLGRFRLSATSDASPFLPESFRPATATLTAQAPATKTGGLIFLTGGNPEDTPRATLGGRPIPFDSVWASRSNWGCPWTAWRAEIGPSFDARALEIKVKLPRANADRTYTVHFLPN